MVGQPIADPVAAAVDLPPLDTVSFWSSAVLQNKSVLPRQGLLVGGVYWDATGLKLHGGGGNAVWQGPSYPNASTDFAANAKVTQRCGKAGCLYDVVNDIGEHVDLAAARPADLLRMTKAKAAATGVVREHTCLWLAQEQPFSCVGRACSPTGRGLFFARRSNHCCTHARTHMSGRKARCENTAIHSTDNGSRHDR